MIIYDYITENVNDFYNKRRINVNNELGLRKI